MKALIILLFTILSFNVFADSEKSSPQVGQNDGKPPCPFINASTKAKVVSSDSEDKKDVPATVKTLSK